MNKVKKLRSIFLCALLLLNIGTVFGGLTKDELQGGLNNAVRGGDKRKVAGFLKKGANINDNEFPPLNVAVAENNKYMVEFLLKNGADINKGFNRDYRNYHSMFERAYDDGKYSVIPTLLRWMKGKRYLQGVKKLTGWTKLHLAAMEGDAKQVKNLLDAGWAVDSQDKIGKTALHWATESLHIKTIKLLLERVANPNHQDNRGYAPLFTAVFAAPDEGFPDEKKLTLCLEACDLLLKHGADLRIKNADGFSVLGLYNEPVFWCCLNRTVRKFLVSRLPFYLRAVERVNDIFYYLDKKSLQKD